MKRLGTLLKILVSGGLVVYLMTFIDFGKSLETATRSNPVYMAAAVLLYLATFPVIAYRWKIMLAVQKVRLGISVLTRFYFMGFFFNNFLPTSIGGDVVRIYKSSRRSGQAAACAAAVVLERVLGLLAILFLAVLGLLYTADRLRNPLLTGTGLVLLVGLVVVFLLLTRRRGLDLIERVGGYITWRGLDARIRQMTGVFRVYRTRYRALAGVFLLSCVYQGIMMLFAFAISRAVGTGLPVTDFLVCVPVVALLGLLPSINGLGVRESGFVYLFMRLGGPGMERELALSFSLLVLATGIVVSLAGGVLFALDRDRVSVHEMSSAGKEMENL